MTFFKNVDLENEDEATIMLFVTLVYPLLSCFCIVRALTLLLCL